MLFRNCAPQAVGMRIMISCGKYVIWKIYGFVALNCAGESSTATCLHPDAFSNAHFKLWALLCHVAGAEAGAEGFGWRGAQRRGRGRILPGPHEQGTALRLLPTLLVSWCVVIMVTGGL